MDFVNQLVNFILTPAGLVLLGCSLFIPIQANQNHPRFRWFLVSFFGFAASLSAFTDEYIKVPPPLVFPLQEIRQFGRPLAILLLVLLLVISLNTKNIWRKKIIPQPIIYICLVQCAIVCKILTSGSSSFAFLGGATFGSLVLVVILGPSRWLDNDDSFQLGVWAIAMVGVIFTLVNGYQALFDLYPLAFIHGWFLGTTGNPHHAAILIDATIPSLLFMFFNTKQRKYVWLKWLWAVFFCLEAIVLLMTASRTGISVFIVSILIFFRYRLGRLSLIIVLAALLISLLIPDFTSSSKPELFSRTVDKFEAGENTRGNVWNRYLGAFLEYPVIGEPLKGDRLRFGESSWLGVFGALGLAGGLPMLMFGWSSFKMIIKLDHLSKIRPNYYLKCSVVMSGLLSLLFGGISEAYLLGNLTLPVLAVLLYLVLGNYIIEFAKRENDNFISQYYNSYMLSSVEDDSKNVT